MKRVLLTTVYRPFCVDDPFDSVHNQVQHGTTHRQFTREQGVFTIHQQCSHLALHLIAANLEAETDVIEYPSLEEFRGIVEDAVREGRPYDFVGVSATASYVRKARRMCEVVREVSPGSATVLGGGAALAVGEVVEPFADHTCPGEGVTFLRALLGQDPAAPITHPVVWSVHAPNEILSTKANSAGYSLAVTLGCDRGCSFCSTSAQFGGQRIPVLKTGAEILAAMETVAADRGARGEAETPVQFVIFDENFLSDHALARDFHRLNREQTAKGRLFLSFVFADARNVQRFTPEQLLEMGVDALWVGMEAADGGGWHKNRDVDFARIVTDLQSHGIKVFLSFIAGRPDQTAESIARDVDYALGLEASAYQYAMACPFPGTPEYARLKRAGLLAVERPEQLNMSHYYIRHDGLTAADVLRTTTEFQRRDYERHGPLALRFSRLRLSGYLRHRDSANPALRHRARAFRDDVLSTIGVLPIGAVFAPNAHVRRKFRETHRQVLRHVRLRPLLVDTLRGRSPVGNVLHFAFFSAPGLKQAVLAYSVARILRWDPRTRDRCASLLGLLRHGRACVREASTGVMPWGQPELVRTRYPRPAAAPAPTWADRLRNRLRTAAAAFSRGRNGTGG